MPAVSKLPVTPLPKKPFQAASRPSVPQTGYLKTGKRFMNYSEFLTLLDEHYYAYYDKGLKKQANANLKALMQAFDALPQETRDPVWEAFCRDYFDGRRDKYGRNRHNARGNGGIHHELSLRLAAYLQQQSGQNRMPHLRWQYQFGGDPKPLQCAYARPGCDAETVKLMFLRMLNDLYWWQHHFPDGCLTTEETAARHLSRCAGFAGRHPGLPDALLDELRYYQKLYPVYWEWSAKHRDTIPFEDFCRRNGLSFHAETAYYYG